MAIRGSSQHGCAFSPGSTGRRARPTLLTGSLRGKTLNHGSWSRFPFPRLSCQLSGRSCRVGPVGDFVRVSRWSHPVPIGADLAYGCPVASANTPVVEGVLGWVLPPTSTLDPPSEGEHLSLGCRMNRHYFGCGALPNGCPSGSCLVRGRRMWFMPGSRPAAVVSNFLEKTDLFGLHTKTANLSNPEHSMSASLDPRADRALAQGANQHGWIRFRRAPRSKSRPPLNITTARRRFPSPSQWGRGV